MKTVTKIQKLACDAENGVCGIPEFTIETLQ